MSKDISINQGLFHEIRSLIEEARSNVVVAVNAELTILYLEYRQADQQ